MGHNSLGCGFKVHYGEYKRAEPEQRKCSLSDTILFLFQNNFKGYLLIYTNCFVCTCSITQASNYPMFLVFDSLVQVFKPSHSVNLQYVGVCLIFVLVAPCFFSVLLCVLCFVCTFPSPVIVSIVCTYVSFICMYRV